MPRWLGSDSTTLDSPSPKIWLSVVDDFRGIIVECCFLFSFVSFCSSCFVLESVDLFTRLVCHGFGCHPLISCGVHLAVHNAFAKEGDVLE